MQLRPYQEELVGSVLAARERGRQRVLAASPTGTGKTVSFVALHNRWPEPGKTLVLAHREELLEQAAASFQRADPQCWVEIEQASRKAGGFADVVVASVQTLGRPGSKRLDWLRPRLVVCDEAHHAPAATYVETFRRFGCLTPGGPFLFGCTATPKRLDKLNLHSIFEEQVFSYGIQDAIEDGWLAEIVGYRVETKTDLTRIKTTAGDFNAGQLEEAVDNRERTAAAVRHWQEVAADRLTIVFCAGVAHAEHTAAAFREAGVAAEHLHGGMDRETRREILARFRSSAASVLCNVDILTEGFDCPQVACIVMLRPTQSWALYVQCIGRGTRLHDGKPNLIVIDVMDNCKEHSLASVPAILDLPPGLDLQGESLTRAARALSELGERAEALLADLQPKLFSDIETLLQQVDLFRHSEVPAEVREAGCRLAWKKLGDGSYHVACGPGRLGMRRARLLQDGGRWTLCLTDGDRILSRGSPHPGMSFRDVLTRCDYSVRLRWPDAVDVAGQLAWRRKEPATEGQQFALRQQGVAPEIIGALDRKAASGMLTQLLARGKAA